MPDDKPAGAIGRFFGPSAGQFVLGAVWVAVLVGGIALLALQLFATRTAFYERRDIRELDAVGRQITRSVSALSINAGEQFDPNSLIFTFSPAAKCLVAVARVPTEGGRLVRVSYSFTDRDRTQAWLSALAKFDDRFLDPSKITPAAPMTAPAIPGVSSISVDACRVGRTRGSSPPPVTKLSPSSIEVSRDISLSSLLWASTFVPPNESPATARKFLQDKLVTVARDYVGKDPLAVWPSGDLSSGESDQLQRIERSIATAFESDTIRFNASLGGGVPLRPAGSNLFVAFKLLGPDTDGKGTAKTPELLWQSGQIPPVIDRSDLQGADRFVSDLLGGTPKAAGNSAPVAVPKAIADPDAVVTRVNGLVVYQIAYAGAPGLDCSSVRPCRLIGVRNEASFKQDVQKIDGIQATWLLIGVLTGIAFIPLIQLILRGQLEPISRAAQYVLWLSLSFLVANAAIAMATIWSESAGREAAERTIASTDGVASKLDAAVGASLAASQKRMAGWTTQLRANPQGTATEAFPVPVTPSYKSFALSRGAPVVGLYPQTVTVYDERGRAAPGWPRLSAARYPSYGHDVSGADYFRRAMSSGGDDLAGDSFDSDRPVYFGIEDVSPDAPPQTVFAQRLLKSDCARPNTPPSAPTADTPSPNTNRQATPHKCVVVATGLLPLAEQLYVPAGLDWAIIRSADERNPQTLYQSGRETLVAGSLLDDVLDRDRDVVADALRSPVPDEPVETEVLGNPVRLWVRSVAAPGDATGVKSWRIVVIEQLSDRGFAVWREALFGYLAWVIALGIGLLAVFALQLQYPGAFDRRPFMWLWPNAELYRWTAPRLLAEQDDKSLVEKRANEQHRFLLIVAVLAIFVMFVDTWARLPYALAITAAVLTSRTSYDGSFAANREAGKKLDHLTSWLSIAFSALAALSALFGMYELGLAALRNANLTDLARIALGILLPTILAVLVLKRMRLAQPPILQGDGLPSNRANSLRSMLPKWILGLILLSATPAIAGFVDAHDANVAWADKASKSSRCAFLTQRDRRIARLNETLVADAQIVTRGASAACQLADPPMNADGDGRHAVTSWALTATTWLKRDREAIGSAKLISHHWGIPTAQALTKMLACLLILILALIAFRRAFFSAQSVGLRDPQPLTAQVLKDVIRQGLPSDAKLSPFARSLGNCHLIVGAGPAFFEDLTDDGAVLSVTLGDPLSDVSGKKSVLLRNFETALLDATSRDTALETLKTLLKTPVSQLAPQLYLFASTEPLDRMRALRSSVVSPAADPAWVDALSSFALYHVEQADPAGASVTKALAQDLWVTEVSSARRVADQIDQSEELSSVAMSPAETDFAAELMAEFYQAVWNRSTPEEQTILFNLAQGAQLKMEDSPGLRALITRKLVVRMPEYRLMNDSIAFFIRTTIRRSDVSAATNNLDRVWPYLRIPVAVIVVTGVAALATLTPGDGLAAVFPALTAALPALAGAWLKPRTPA